MSAVRISHPTRKISGRIHLDGSKSISNRVLIIQALCNDNFEIQHLSTCDDTSTLKSLLLEEHTEYDAHHAGTTFRFMTAYLSVQQGTQILTGSQRMKERPIGALVNALRDLGAKIDYLNNEGFPPLRIHPFNPDNYKASIKVKADISSQYITALLLIAPVLPRGLELNLIGELVSEPYLNMTLSVLSEFGIEYQKTGGKIVVKPQEYIAKNYTVEADWSACSYYYSIAALADEADIYLEGLFVQSIQGDAKMKDIGSLFGVKSEFVKNSHSEDVLHLTKNNNFESHIIYDFINQPDIAQTVAVMCSGLGIKGDFTGLKTLRIKETDRIAALQNELGKINSYFELDHINEGQEFYVINKKASFDTTPIFATYKDHRMAMAFAPLSLLHPIEIENPEVVRKSYTGFWQDLECLGFEIETLT